LKLPSDFGNEISKALNWKLEQVLEWFTLEEDKEGYFWARLKLTKFLETPELAARAAADSNPTEPSGGRLGARLRFVGGKKEMTGKKLRVRWVCTVRYCGNNPPRFSPRPSGKCSTLYHCANARCET
jgi:hypothetical protein